MRIIGGRFRGRRLVTVRGEIRPTQDRLRESIFAHLEPGMRGSVWVDLFAGTGAVGIEALSRGAAFVAFNDRDLQALRILRKNLQKLDLPFPYLVTRQDAFAFLRKPPRLPGYESVSHVFLDPPFDFGRYRKLLAKTALCPLFRSGETLIVLELFKKTRIDFIPEDMTIERRFDCGDVTLLTIR